MLGSSEILIIMIAALFIIGPSKIPELAKSLAHAMVEYQNALKEFKREVNMAASEGSEPPVEKELIENKTEQEKPNTETTAS